MNYKVTAERVALMGDGETGIQIRAQGPDGKWGTFDIGHLDKPSLLAWLRSRGGDNKWAENVVGILLGHGHLHSTTSTKDRA
jgi:hypothetical protein